MRTVRNGPASRRAPSLAAGLPRTEARVMNVSRRRRHLAAWWRVAAAAVLVARAAGAVPALDAGAPSAPAPAPTPAPHPHPPPTPAPPPTPTPPFHPGHPAHFP